MFHSQTQTTALKFGLWNLDKLGVSQGARGSRASWEWVSQGARGSESGSPREWVREPKGVSQGARGSRASWEWVREPEGVGQVARLTFFLCGRRWLFTKLVNIICNLDYGCLANHSQLHNDFELVKNKNLSLEQEGAVKYELKNADLNGILRHSCSTHLDHLAPLCLRVITRDGNHFDLLGLGGSVCHGQGHLPVSGTVCGMRSKASTNKMKCL